MTARALEASAPPVLPISQRTGALLLSWGFGVYGSLLGLPEHPAQEAQLLVGARFQAHLFPSGEFAPPLLHVLLGLLARVPGLGLERAWAVLVALVPVLLTWSVSRWVERTHGASSADLAAWLTAASPLVFLFCLPLAQVPMVAGTALAFLAASSWVDRPVAGGCFAVAAIATHVVAVPLLVALALANWQGRKLLGAGLALLVGAALVWPSLAALTNASAAQTFEREGVLRSVLGGAVITSAFIGAVLGGGTARAVAVAQVLCFALGWRLNSSSFVWLSAVLVPVSLGCLHERIGSRLVALAVPLALLSAWAPGHPWQTSAGVRRTALAEARVVLEKPEARQFSYLTFGLGSARFELARKVQAQAEESLGGPDAVDEWNLSDAATRERFTSALTGVGQSVRWVLSADERANAALEATGFALRAAWRGELTLWERVAARPLSADLREVARSWRTRAQVVVSLLALLIGLALVSRRSTVTA